MKKLKGILLSCLSMGVLIGGFATPTYASVVQQSNQVTQITDSESRVPMYREKTIVKFYKNFSDIPESVSYQEYQAGIMWSGRLYVKSTQQTSAGWNATFTGTLAGNS